MLAFPPPYPSTPREPSMSSGKPDSRAGSPLAGADASAVPAAGEDAAGGWRPPRDEVEALWDASSLADDPGPLTDYLESGRGWSNVNFLRDVARELPASADYSWPSWWPRGRSDGGWRLAVLARESDGTPVSIHARAVVPVDDEPVRLWPNAPPTAKGTSAGLVFACPQGAAILRGDAGRRDSGSAAAPPGWSPLRIRFVLLVHGLTDFLRAVLETRRERLDHVVVIGLTNASHVHRLTLPDHLDVYMAPDGDRTGDETASRWAKAFARRPIRRVSMAPGMDLDDTLTQGEHSLSELLETARAEGRR